MSDYYERIVTFSEDYDNQSSPFTIRLDHPITPQHPKPIYDSNPIFDHSEEIEKSRSPPAKRGKKIGKERKEGKEEKKEKEGEGGRKRYKKREKDPNVSNQMGRPTNEQDQKAHLLENKSYNDIVYHFSRFLIFLKLLQREEKEVHVFEATADQAQWMKRAEDIMKLDNFPTFEERKPNFLLHPNSPHFVFDYLKKHEDKSNYSSHEVYAIILAYLKKKRLLSRGIYDYLLDYWRDIVYLVNNPQGDLNIEDEPEDEEMQSGEAQEMDENENINANRSQNGRVNKKAEPPQYTKLKKQLADDQTIAAYQIACYLHACHKKYQIHFQQ